MELILLVLGTIAASLGVIFILPLRRKRRLRRWIKAAFGRAPEKKRGLFVAEDFLASYSKAFPENRLIDDLTWNDLSGDDLYFRMNNCQSAAGDIQLYQCLRRIEPDFENPTGKGHQRRQMMALFEEKDHLRLEAQLLLAALGRLDGEAIEMTCFQTGSFRLSNRWLYRLLCLLPLLSVGVIFYNLTAGIVLLTLSLMANANVFTVVKNRNDGSFRWARYLASAIICAEKMAILLAKDAPSLATQLKEAGKSMGPLRRSIAVLNFDHATEETMGFDPLSILLLPLLSFGRLAAKMAQSTADMLALYQLLGDVDASISLASFRRSLPYWCPPEYDTESEVSFCQLYHPLLDQPVASTATLSNDVLLTGSNASGKSTFIKAVALNCLFAQTIFTCTAKGFRLRPGFVATSMAVADSVIDGDSYFLAEIKSMRRLVRLAEAQEFCWFFIDEILKGTNTVERVAASSAVLGLLHQANCLCFAATHDIELTSILKGCYQFFHFKETVQDGQVLFDYLLQPGPATSRNAILLLEQMHFPSTMVANARQLATRFEESGQWGQWNSDG